MNVLAALELACRELTAARVPFALVGGLAVSVRADPRFTRDADLAVAVSDDVEAEAVVRRFLAAGFHVAATVEQQATDRLPTVRLVAPSDDEDGSVVDLLFASSGIEREIVDAATPEEIVSGLTLPVATAGHLVAMKVLSEDAIRFQDSADLVALLADGNPDVSAAARDGLRLIAQRGAARGKDLETTLDRYLALVSR